MGGMITATNNCHNVHAACERCIKIRACPLTQTSAQYSVSNINITPQRLDLDLKT